MRLITTEFVIACSGDHPDKQAVGSTWVRVVATRPDNFVADFFVHLPGGATPNQSAQLETSVAGLQLPGFTRMGDISKLEFEVPPLACVDAFYFKFNDRFIVEVANPQASEMRQGWPPNTIARPGNNLVFAITRDDIVAAAAQYDPVAVCEFPLTIYPETVQATVASMLGNLIIRHEDSFFLNDDYVVIVGEGPSVVVEFTVHSSRGKARLLFDLTLSCGPTQPTENDPEPKGSSISIEVGDVTAQEIDGNDALTTIAAELGIAQGYLESEISDQLVSLRRSLGEIARNLPACPNLRFEKASSGVPSVVIQGLPFYPPYLVIDGIPDLTPFGLPPITLCM